jgi:hypothetical protein
VLGSSVPDVSTPWIELLGGYAGSCGTRAGRHILSVHAGQNLPALRYFPDASFGLYVDDLNLVMGNLVQLVRSQATSYLHALASAPG